MKFDELYESLIIDNIDDYQPDLEFNEELFEEEYQEFVEFTNSDLFEEILISPIGKLDEAFKLKIPSKLKEKIEFIKELGKTAGYKIKDLVKLFLKKPVFKFFTLIGWSLKKLFELAKKGMKIYQDILSAISEYISKTPVGQWTEEKLRKLDEFLQKHPKLKKVAGIAIAALLIAIWMNMSFTGSFEYDFDMGDMLSALAGKFALSSLFAGPAGTKLLLLLATGVIGLSFPWPGPQSIQFISSVILGLSKKFKVKIGKEKPA